MLVTIHQPEHMPWLGFFHKMDQADVFVILDNVKFRKSYFQHRNKILTHKGPQYLTTFLDNKTTSSPIKDVKISPNFTTKDYLLTLYYNYCNHPFFDEYFPQLESIIKNRTSSLMELNLAIIDLFRQSLNITTPLVKASELNITGHKTELLLNICKELNATTYLSGPTGKDYLKQDLFDEEGIGIQFHEFTHPTYPQLHTDTFVSHLSTIDLLFNCGDESREYLLGFTSS